MSFIFIAECSALTKSKKYNFGHSMHLLDVKICKSSFLYKQKTFFIHFSHYKSSKSISEEQLIFMLNALYSFFGKAIAYLLICNEKNE